MQSMTGFATSEKTIDGTHFTIEMRSVNHRFLDVRFRLPSSLQSFEAALSDSLRKRFSRGSIEVSVRAKLVQLENRTGGSLRFLVDEKAAKSLSEACALLHRDYEFPAALSHSLVASMGKVIIPVEEVAEHTAMPPGFQPLFDATLQHLADARTTEGKKTQSSILSTVHTLNQLTHQIKALAPLHPALIRDRLTKRLEEWKISPVDSQRLELEVALYAQKSDIAEEIQRLESHLKEYEALLSQTGPVGKKLDFLTQELHRETNTVASKADDLRLTRLALDAKAAIEKLREQVQNVE
jgi:uncharacterized protein (TIGR00255 family)